MDGGLTAYLRATAAKPEQEGASPQTLPNQAVKKSLCVY